MRAGRSLLALASAGSVTAMSYECPSGSILPPFEVSVTWEADADLDLHVLEPGGVEVFYGQMLGDVGMLGGDVFTGPGVETYLLLNGLDPATDRVEDYFYAWVERSGTQDSTQYTLTARSNGIRIWEYTGEFAAGVDKSEVYTAAMYEYYEFDCYVEDYGLCPSGAYSDTGNPPCLACLLGEVSDDGSTVCTPVALQYLDLPVNMADAIMEDAVYGFAGPGYISLDDPLITHSLNVIAADDAGTLHLTGSFRRYDREVIAPSTALYLYYDDGDAETDFIRGQGQVYYETGLFATIVTNIPPGYGRVILSFVVADPEDSPEDMVTEDTVFPVLVVNSGCSAGLTITLEWDTDNSDLDLYVVEPNGNSVYYGQKTGDVGYLDNDVTDGFGPENYILYNGLDVTEDAVLGEYATRVHRINVPTDTTWMLTARVNGGVVWVEQGTFYAEGSASYDYSYGYSYDIDYYSYDMDDTTATGTSDHSESDIFYVSVVDYNGGDCADSGASTGTSAREGGGFLWSSLENEGSS